MSRSNRVLFTEHQQSLLSKKCTKCSILLERGAALVHNLCRHFLTTDLPAILGTDCRVTWRDVMWRDVTSYHTEKDASHTLLQKSKILQNSRHLKKCNCPLRFILWVSPSLGRAKARRHWGRPTRDCPQFVLENITICLQIGHDSHYSFSPHLIRHSSTNHATLNYLNSYRSHYIKDK